jgi:hypothetical protein
VSGQTRNLVLFGFFDWAPVITLAKRCRELGITLHLLAAVSRRGRMRLSDLPPHIGEFSEIEWTELESTNGPARVRAFATRVHADAILSADEGLLHWLARNRGVFEPACRVLASSTGSYEALFSKQAQERVARDAGFDVLDSWYLNGPEDCAALPPNAEYPLCLRPTAAQSVEPGFKAKVLHDPGELKEFLASRTRITAPILAQTFHYGPNLVVHAARSESGEMLALQAFLGYRKFRGFSVSIEPTEVDRRILDSCARFAESVDLVGVFHFDLLRSVATGRTLFLEVNPRMGGTTSKVTQLGYDEPLHALRCFGLPIPSAPPPKRRTARATGKRALLQQISALVKNQEDSFSYPVENRWAALTRSLRDFAWADDQVLQGLGLRRRLWYLTHSFLD